MQPFPAWSNFVMTPPSKHKTPTKCSIFVPPSHSQTLWLPVYLNRASRPCGTLRPVNFSVSPPPPFLQTLSLSGAVPTNQSVNRRSLTAEARVRFWARPCNICGGRNGRGTSFTVSIIPAMLHYHLHRNTTLIRKKSVPHLRTLKVVFWRVSQTHCTRNYFYIRLERVKKCTISLELRLQAFCIVCLSSKPRVTYFL
jgi:hypothetical protein